MKKFRRPLDIFENLNCVYGQYPWDDWERDALAAGVPKDLAGLGRLTVREAYQHAWIPAVAGAGEEAGRVYARHGLDALELGDEAVVEAAEFTLEGRAMRVVR